MEQLAIAQQIEVLQQQQQQIAATHQQYVNMGMIQPQQHLPGNFQMQGQMSNVSPHTNQFQFPQQMPQQHLAVPMNAPSQPSSHRRNQSALPNVMGGPPPAPSSGASGFGEYGGQQGAQGRENVNPRGRGGGGAGSGHNRRHSLALPEAKKAAELAEQKRKTSGFQFPIPSAGGSSNRDASPSGNSQTDQAPASRGGRGGHGRSQSMAVGRGGGNAGRGGPSFQFPAPQSNDNNNGSQTGQSDFQRRGSSGHGRSQSRNFDGNWRQPQNQQQQTEQQNNQAQNMGNFNMNQTANAAPFQPGHRTRGSVNQSIGSIGNFQYPGGPQLMQLPQGQVLVPQMFGAQGLNPMQIAHLQALQAAQLNGGGMGGLQGGQHGQPQMMQQQQQQRKTLFTPYLPQATLPALLSDGQLVAGILRVNKKNRSDAYVTTTDLDADIFICGSKDRNRALEGDLVAVELLDVDEVWGQKREKEEKKKRKDNADPRGGSNIAVNDATTQPETSQGEGGIRRRGSLRQRPTQKKNDDVEVEGQSLLLMEEEEINDEQKPLYAGHIVAVIERVAGQMFSG